MKDGERLLALSELTLWARAEVELRIEMDGELTEAGTVPADVLEFNRDQRAFWQRMLQALEATLKRETGRGPQTETMLVLLECFYEGDSWLVDTGFLACGHLEALKRLVPEGAELFMPGETVPDDGGYGDTRKRYRIIEVPVLDQWAGTCGPGVRGHRGVEGQPGKPVGPIGGEGAG